MKLLYVLLTLFALEVAAKPLTPSQFRNRPKLVVLLVIDQFRGDYLTRFRHRFLPQKQGERWGGFSYLLDRGAWFPQAQFDILQNMTAPGHATLLTGAYSYLTGIPTNEWFDGQQASPVYCAQDDSFEWFTGKPASRVGTSPKNLNGTTLGDELKMIHPESRVVSLSLKDRSAILMGGRRADAVVWMDPAKFQWTSTKFYFPGNALPDWVKAVNATLETRQQAKIESGPARSPASFLGKGLLWGDKKAMGTPAGNTVTLDLAEKAIEHFKLGNGKGTDLLAVSLSSHDYAGHQYGPNAPEMEEMTLADDAALARLFNFLQAKLPHGMKDVLVVLTADHGVGSNAEWLQQDRIEAGRVDEEKVREQINARLARVFGTVEGGWVLRAKTMNFYLNQKALEKKYGERALVEKEAKTELMKIPGMAYAFSSTDYEARTLPPGILQRQILNSYYPGRSGDIIGILKPYFSSGGDPTEHQTGYAYDRTVPIVFAGAGIAAGVHGTNAEPVDIAPTLAFLLGTVPPSQTHGRVLHEIFGNQKNE